ncbi:MAG: hypothetical protein K5673_06065, partial [Lachnospiraceae bacterium]|nr:hypothetical protein [Lachnospiraceae bacterium]
MKVVKNYKGLKKWAKTAFIALLTICIIFTTTGVGTLIAYAFPDNEICTNGGAHTWSDVPVFVEENTHKYVCTVCGAEMTDNCSFIGYLEKDESVHYRYCICGNTFEEAHSFDENGDCACGFHQDQISNTPELNNMLQNNNVRRGAGNNLLGSGNN